jgi:hypothetical protein
MGFSPLPRNVDHAEASILDNLSHVRRASVHKFRAQLDWRAHAVIVDSENTSANAFARLDQNDVDAALLESASRSQASHAGTDYYDVGQ